MNERPRLRLIKLVVVRPVVLFGRVLGTSEVCRLPEADALPLLASGHLRAAEVPVEVVAPEHNDCRAAA